MPVRQPAMAHVLRVCLSLLTLCVVASIPSRAQAPKQAQGLEALTVVTANQC